MSIDLAQFHQTFFEESFEGLDAMESALLHLDVGTPDMEMINTIFRAAHSIKGGSGTFGFHDMTAFTHLLETLLDAMRDGRRQVTQEAVDLLLQSVDCLRDMLTALQDGAEIDAQRVSHLQAQFEALLQTPQRMDHEQPTPSPAAGGVGLPEAQLCGWHIRFRPQAHMLSTGNDPVLMFRELETLGDLRIRVDTSRLPAFADLDPEDCYLSWELTLRGDIPHAQVHEIFEWVEGDCELHITPLQEERIALADAEAMQEPRPLAETQETAASQQDADRDQNQRERRSGVDRRRAALSPESNSIRVRIDKIDALINMVGELVITQAMLSQLGENFDLSRLERLRDGLDQLERNTRELQESVMRIRMLPISFAFNRFPRLVHDLSQQLGKQVTLKTSGEQTELDKTVMEKIGDPLVHLVRNAVDHGIESPQARKAAGKPETGLLHLNASHQGGNIVIEISDDGAGLQREKILRKARERGLVVDDEMLPDEKVYDLLFHPGFSTADVVSDVSGRGVGLDVVRRNIRELGGHIEVRSQAGQGTCFTIRLPLTLAILDGQLARLGQETYIIPLVSIVESLQIEPERVNTLAGQAELYRHRDDHIPIVRLCDLFHQRADRTEPGNALLVVVEADGQRAGLTVDELLGQQQIVIKSLETNFKRVQGISGATILGDGTVALILDMAGLMHLAHHRVAMPQRHLFKGEALAVAEGNHV